MTTFQVFVIVLAAAVGGGVAELAVYYIRRAQMFRDEKSHMERMRKNYQDQVQEVRNLVEGFTGRKPGGIPCPKCQATGSFIVVQAGDQSFKTCVSCGDKAEVKP